MKRLKDEYLDLIERKVPLSLKSILEIGSGNGGRTKQLAKRGAFVTAIEPNAELVEYAKANNNPDANITYLPGKAEALGFQNAYFDIVLFTLSFHHVPFEMMQKALEEAVRVTKKGGHVIFLEPTENGTFFDAEIGFDACDGDERENKKVAYGMLKNFKDYTEVAEIEDETVLQFDSLDDFTKAMSPKSNVENLEQFLEANSYTLNAHRRINIFQV